VEKKEKRRFWLAEANMKKKNDERGRAEVQEMIGSGNL